MTRPPQTLIENQEQLPQSLAAVSDRLFFNHLLHHGPDSRANIAATVGLSRPTASEAAQRLSAAGLIISAQRPAELVPVKRGRTPDFYDINSTYGHTLAIAAASGRARVRTQDLRGGVLKEFSQELPEDMTGSELKEALRLLAKQAVRATGNRCLAATASQGNPVNPVSQRAIELPNTPFPEGLGDLVSVLRTVCDGPVRLDNDVNWATLAEHQVGGASGMDDVVLFYIGPGVGAGIVMSGTVQRGQRGTAGELGYLRYSGRSLMSHLLEFGVASPGGERLDVERTKELFMASPPGDGAQRFVDALASAMGNIATFLDPRALVISGPFSRCGEFMDMLRDALNPHFLDGELEVVVSALDEDAPLLGAGLAATELAYEQIWATYRS